jgi:hypothetical protein
MLNSSAPYEEVLPGEMASFSLVVKNPGNAVDSYELEIENLKQLKEQGWSVELDKTSISNLGPNGEVEITITAKHSQDWSWELYTSEATLIILKANSLGAQANSTVISQIFPLNAYQKGFNTPLVNLISGVTVALVVLVVVGIVIRRRKRKARNEQVTGEPVDR